MAVVSLTIAIWILMVMDFNGYGFLGTIFIDYSFFFFSLRNSSEVGSKKNFWIVKLKCASDHFDIQMIKVNGEYILIVVPWSSIHLNGIKRVQSKNEQSSTIE